MRNASSDKATILTYSCRAACKAHTRTRLGHSRSGGLGEEEEGGGGGRNATLTLFPALSSAFRTPNAHR